MDEHKYFRKLPKWTQDLLEMESSSLTNYSATDSYINEEKHVSAREIFFAYRDLNIMKKDERKELDHSINPSYYDLKPYRVICYERALNMKKKMVKQYVQEIWDLVQAQPTAVEGAKFYRTMSYTSLWPPLHTRKEIENMSKLKHFHFSKKQKKRLEYIINNTIT